jgi:hypothetical protein
LFFQVQTWSPFYFLLPLSLPTLLFPPYSVCQQVHCSALISCLLHLLLMDDIV